MKIQEREEAERRREKNFTLEGTKRMREVEDEEQPAAMKVSDGKGVRESSTIERVPERRTEMRKWMRKME